MSARYRFPCDIFDGLGVQCIRDCLSMSWVNLPGVTCVCSFVGVTRLLGDSESMEDLHVTSSMTSPMVAAMLEVFLSRRAGRFKNVAMHQIKPELRRQDLEGFHLPSFRFSWKIKKLCRVDFFVFESWQTALRSPFRSHTTVCTCFGHLQPPKGVPYCHHEYYAIWYGQSIISTALSNSCCFALFLPLISFHFPKSKKRTSAWRKPF
jgi:hypothetical protein